MLYTIVYLSYPHRRMAKEDLNAILHTSRDNNQKLDITGVLVYSSSTFIQVLEGDKGIITDLYDKIKKDKRHHGAFIVFEGPLASRAFSNWSMGFKSMSEEELAEFKSNLNLDDPKLLNNLPALSILEAFYELL